MDVVYDIYYMKLGDFQVISGYFVLRCTHMIDDLNENYKYLKIQNMLPNTIHALGGISSI